MFPLAISNAFLQFETYLFLCFLYGFLFSSVGTYFFNLHLLYIALRNFLVMNDAWIMKCS